MRYDDCLHVRKTTGALFMSYTGYEYSEHRNAISIAREATRANETNKCTKREYGDYS